MENKDNRGEFVIRVYGILINDIDQILLSDEYRSGTLMTKFPGGGLEFGEGPEDCLRREALEEFGQPVELISHFYTTGFFQKAMFFENHQLISIYYKMQFLDTPAFRISSTPFDFDNMTEGSQAFRWKNLENLKDEDVSFPIDKFVVMMLLSEYNKRVDNPGI